MKKFYFLTLALICAFAANAKTVEIRGAFNGWTEGADILTETSTGVWEITKDASYFNNCEAKIVIDGIWCGGSELSNNSTISLDYNAGNNFKITGLGGIKTATIKVVDKGSDKYEVSLSGYGLASYPEKVYLLGHIDGITAWAPNSAVTVASIGEGVYKAVDVTIANSGDGYGYFAFAENKSANVSDWDGLGTRYGAASKDALVEVGGEYKMVKGTNSWKLAVGMYDLTLDLVNSKLFVSESTTAIDEVAVDNATVEYYNLQGVKVANPENGIFIKKQGNKVAKVVL